MFSKKSKASSGLTAEIRVNRCYGCGAVLQSVNPNEAGYVPKEKLDNNEETLCERCYKLRYYNQYKEINSLNIGYVTILDAAKEENALAVYVLNAFSLEASLLSGIGQYLSSKVLVVINKRDLLPKKIDDEYLINKAKSLLEKENVHPLNVIVTSASTSNKSNIEDLLADINNYRDNKNVYFIGAYQVGKSTIINALLMYYNNSTSKVITTSPYPGTTLDVISIPLDNKTYIYDTPGIYNKSSIISAIDPKIIKYVLPRSEVRPETYLAKEGQSFLFSNLVRFDYLKGGKVSFTFYKSNDLTIERCKLNKADDTFASIALNSSIDTRSEKFTSINTLNKTHLHAIKNQPNRINIYGLGFIDFVGNDEEFDVYAPNDVVVEITTPTVKL